MTERQKTLFDLELSRRLALGWQVVSDGPSGISLTGPQKNRSQTTLGYVLGVLLLPIGGVGILFLLAAYFDDRLAKPETVFIRRG
jgi:hypothetical protein